MPAYRSNSLMCRETGFLPLVQFGQIDRFGYTPAPIGLSMESCATKARVEDEAEELIRRLFLMCLNPQSGLNASDWAAAAESLGVESEVIQAVAAVEAPRGAFDDSGRPTILYERHYFHRLTQGAYSTSHQQISASSAGGYGRFSAQYGKLEEAFGLDAESALKSVSWGRFQIMGANFKAAGYSSVEAMVLDMMKSERAQLDAFVNFIKSDSKMHSALKKKDWAGFAARYNGKAYKKNNYDQKLRGEFDRLTRVTSPAANASPPAVHTPPIVTSPR